MRKTPSCSPLAALAAPPPQAQLPGLPGGVRPAAAAAGAVRASTRCAPTSPRNRAARPSISAADSVELGRAGEGDARGAGDVAAAASGGRGPDRRPWRFGRHARPCAGGRRAARRGSARAIWCCWECPRRRSRRTSWGKERPGPRPRRHDPGALSSGGAALIAGGWRARRAPGAGLRRSRARSFRARSRRGIPGRGCCPTGRRG